MRAQVIEDLQEECGRYGQIIKVIVPRPPNPAASASIFGQGNFGKVRSSVVVLLLMM